MKRRHTKRVLWKESGLWSDEGSTMAEVLVSLFLFALLAAASAGLFLSTGRMSGQSMQRIREDADFYREYYQDSGKLKKTVVSTEEALSFVPSEDCAEAEDEGFFLPYIQLNRYTEDGKSGVIYEVEKKNGF